MNSGKDVWKTWNTFESSDIHNKQKKSVAEQLARIRSDIGIHRERLLFQVRDLETLAENKLTLPRQRDEYRKHIKEFRDLIARLDERLVSFERTSEVSEIETDDAKYRLVYENHTIKHSPKVLEDLDAYVLEYPGDIQFCEPERHIPDSSDGPIVVGGSTTGANEPIVNVIRESKLPMFSCDINGKCLLKATEMDMAKGSAVEIAVTLLGVKLLWDSGSELLGEKKEMTRRRFLSIAGKFIAGSVLFGSKLSEAADLMEFSATGSNHKMEGIQKMRSELIRSLGFYEVLIGFRNLVMAQKLHTVAGLFSRKPEGGVKPHVGMELGSCHYGIEEYLRMPEEQRLELMRKVAEKAGLLIEWPDDEIATIFRYEFEDESGLWSSKSIIDSAILETFKGYPRSRTKLISGEVI